MWIIGQRKGLPYRDIWSHFISDAALDDTNVSFRASGKDQPRLPAARVTPMLEIGPLPAFGVVCDAFEFRYCQIGSKDYDALFLKGSADILFPDRADRIIDATLATNPCFTQAHLVDSRYYHLQNIFDPLQFKALGLSLDGLPMKSNGLPKPLEQMIVDTDNNPGRYRLHHRYVEAVGGFMWFGPNFWTVTGATPERIARNLPENVQWTFDACWKLRANHGIFRSAETRDTQDAIRRAVFE